jgi:hypothetical protein
MGRVVLITLSDYRAIMQWDEDGGGADITYEIVSDLPADNESPKLDEPGSLDVTTDAVDRSLVGAH